MEVTRLTRRELLTAFLGAPAALAICGCGTSSDTPPLPPGRLVGASAGIGHRLRDGMRVQVPPGRWQDVDVVIVGAGVAGLSAARRLQMAGVEDFVVLELEPAVGGTARSGRNQVAAYPWGAHYLPAPRANNAALVDLLDEMDVFEGRDADGQPIVAEQLLCRDPQERVFYKGRWYPGLYLYAGASPQDEAELARFEQQVDQLVAWRDTQQRRAFTVPLADCSDDPEITQLDQLTMADWLRQNDYQSERLWWYVDYACRDDYGMTVEDTSAWAGLFYFAARVPGPDEESQPFITWPEGNGRLIDHLARFAKGRIETGRAVLNIQPTTASGGSETGTSTADARTAAADATPRLEITTVDHEGAKPRGWRARQVVFAAPQFLSRYILTGYRVAPPDHVSAFTYGAWMVANLTLKERPSGRGFPLAWDNVLYESPSLGYVLATHQEGRDYGPTVLTYYYPLCDSDPREARKRLLSLERDAWAEIALSDLQRAHPDIRALTERIDVMRWGHAMIRPRPGFIWGDSRRQAQLPFQGIHFAHSDLSGLPLFEEAFYHGNRAAEGVLEALGREFSTIL